VKGAQDFFGEWLVEVVRDLQTSSVPPEGSLRTRLDRYQPGDGLPGLEERPRGGRPPAFASRPPASSPSAASLNRSWEPTFEWRFTRSDLTKVLERLADKPDYRTAA
jgi:hypothetical protein